MSYSLKRASLNNWYTFVARDIPIFDVTAVIGVSGAGKSTLQDAIQVVLTGNNGNFVKLNASAGVSSTRTVKSYCLGQISDVDAGRPMRQEAETTLVLTYENRENGDCIAIGVMLKASADEPREEVHKLFVAVGLDFRFADFLVKDDQDRDCVMMQDDIMDRIKASPGVDLRVHQGREKLVEDFFAATQPRHPPNVKKVLRNITNAASMKEISKPDEFVKKFVVPEVDLNVDDVRKRILDWRRTEEILRKTEDKARLIHQVVTTATNAVRIDLRDQANRWRTLEVDRIEAMAARAEHAEAQAAAAGQVIALSGEIGNLEAQTEIVRRNLFALEQELLGTAAMQRILQLQRDMELADVARKQIVPQIRGMLAPLAAVTSLDKASAFMAERFREAAAGSVLIRQIVDGGLEVALRDPATLISAIQRTAAVAEAAKPFEVQTEAKVAQAALLRGRLSEDRRNLEQMRSGVRVVPTSVRDFQKVLVEHGIETRLLPEVVDVVDQSWGKAIELVLGTDRFALIVSDPAQSKAAHEVLHRHRRRFGDCRLILTDRLGKVDDDINSRSLFTQISTENAHARAFLATRLRGIRMAADDDELKSFGNAITREGKRTSGALGRTYNDSSFIPCFGRVKMDDAIARVAAEVQSNEAELVALDADIAVLKAASVTVIGVRSLDVETLFAKIGEARKAIEQHAVAAAAIEDAVDDEARGVKERIAVVQKAKADLDAKREAARTSMERAVRADENAKYRIEEIDRAVAAAAAEAAELERKQEHPKVVRAIRLGNLDQATIEHHRQQFGAKMLHARDDVAAFARLEREAIQKDEPTPLNRRRRNDQVKEALDDFAEAFGTHHAVPERPVGLDHDFHDVLEWAYELRQRVRENELLPYKAQVEQARAEMETSLKEGLLMKLGNAFDQARSELRYLNHLLEDQRFFTGVTYEFKSDFDPRFEPIRKAIERIRNASPGSGDLLSAEGAAGDGDLMEALKLIEEMIGDENAKERFADYKNYMTFDLLFRTDAGAISAADVEKAPPQSLAKVIGDFSGGQRKAPYYVAIAAAFTAAYFPQARAEADRGSGVVLLDEAFSSLDIGNTRRLVDMYRDLGLQLIVAAPEEKRASLMQCVDGFINVWRQDQTRKVVLRWEGISEHAREQVRLENPETKGLEGFRAAAAASAAIVGDNSVN